MQSWSSNRRRSYVAFRMNSKVSFRGPFEQQECQVPSRNGLSRSKAPGGSFWNTARLLYEGAFGSTSAIDKSAALASSPDEATLKSFLDACPPVRAYVYALELTLYDRSLRPLKAPSYKAGRNDQMMAVFLPYCDLFLTNDGGQEKSLREAALRAGVPVEVRSYNDFLCKLDHNCLIQSIVRELKRCEGAQRQRIR